MYLAVSGTCYWCMEAIFRAVRGVSSVEQGFVKTRGSHFVEAALMELDEKILPLNALVRIHLSSHAATANHSARGKYPSAVYPMDSAQLIRCKQAIASAALENGEAVVTQALPFLAFYPNPAKQQDYFWRQPEKPFCQRTILPKLKALALGFPRAITPQAAQFLRDEVYKQQA
ncbi:peptide-methionine (S)-S-oxide reductase [Enterovibrio paralichthyis]|uniref:peptide-methionine (S)-S-oxide reductase n=1 Tax=Enterovibrio paralichthyis TaxID=2853805 RepID=UPI001C48E8A1|nr:peptide-methionine (S)-S-oxide reductase [Enterovibrio paralichthyis]MBV7297473.1 peptide-methionine (S)-S-oxide reductase [Enterovibrio paralichthyis]